MLLLQARLLGQLAWPPWITWLHLSILLLPLLLLIMSMLPLLLLLVVLKLARTTVASIAAAVPTAAAYGVAVRPTLLVFLHILLGRLPRDPPELPAAVDT